MNIYFLRECSDGADENSLFCNESPIFNIIFSVFLVILGIILILPKVWRSFIKGGNFDKSKDKQTSLSEKFHAVLSRYESNHIDKVIIQELNEVMLEINFYETVKIKKKIVGKLVFDLEAKYHKRDEKEIYDCLHKRFHDSLISMIVHNLSFMDRLKDKLVFKWDKFKILPKIWSILIWFRGLGHVYFDTVKDVHIGIILVFLAGGGSMFLNPTGFPSVLAILFWLTILVPSLISSLHLCIYNPSMIFQNFQEKPIWLKILMRAGIVVLSIINPIIMINKYEEMNDKMINYALNGNRITAEFVDKLRKMNEQWVIFFKTELFLELFYQVALQIIILFLTETDTGTVSLPGLRAIIGNSSFFFIRDINPTVFLALSIMWSMKSCISLQIKSIAIKKGYCQFKTKVILACYALFSTFRRILSIVIFFAPSLGLFSILHHWQEEQIPFKIRMQYPEKTKPTDKIVLYNLTDTIKWGDYDRTNYLDPKKPVPPDYFLYTGRMETGL